MISEPDLYQSAFILLQSDGSDAPGFAQRMARQSEKLGFADGPADWRRIQGVLDELLARRETGDRRAALPTG